MALESATYINQLVTTNPDPFDPKGQGDDHLRLLKRVLKQTFPGITGAVTATQAQLNAVTAPGALAFPGMIVMWSGSVESIPSGWKLCNGVGTISTGAAVPNLVNRFIIGTASNNVGQVGGSPDIALSGSVNWTSLAFNIPPGGYGITGQGPSPSTPTIAGGLIAGSGRTENVEILESLSPVIGGPVVDLSHGHTFNIYAAGGNIPPYYVLAFLIKD